MSMNKQETNNFFKQQRIIQYNKTCFTCTKNSPIWVNITLAIYICTDCAGTQRFDPKYKVKSTVLDLWVLEDLKRLKAGGNKLAIQQDLDMEDADDYIKNLDLLVKDITDIFEEKKTVESELSAKIEEKKMPKLGFVAEKKVEVIPKVTSKKVEVKTEKKAEKAFSIKTNDYDFVESTCAKETGVKQEAKYSYKNMQVQRKVKEKGKIENVKDAIKNVTHKSSDLVGKFISKFKK